MSYAVIYKIKITFPVFIKTIQLRLLKKISQGFFVFITIFLFSIISNYTFADIEPEVTINWNSPLVQRIDGFGASSAFIAHDENALSIGDPEAEMFFSKENGIGLSLLRSRIDPYIGTSWELETMKTAQYYGASVWSTPWTPRPEWKTNGMLKGGELEREHYVDYANYLADYVSEMRNNQGVNLYAISVQNEPDWIGTDESCSWSADQIHDFIQDLHKALVSKGLSSTKIMIPEDANWALDLASSTLNDPNTANMVGILAAHNYHADDQDNYDGPSSYINKHGKSLWLTEVSTFDSCQDNIEDAIKWAKNIHEFMTVAKTNAWHYWWLIPKDNTNQGLTDIDHNPTKRMWAIGNFSKFVRPGYYRLDTSSPGDVLVSAYKEPICENFAMIVINNNSMPVTKNFIFSNGFPSNLNTWITNNVFSLEQQSSIEVLNGEFTYTIPPNSIITFEGPKIIAPTPPSNLRISVEYGQIDLCWESPSCDSSIVGYKIYRSTTSGGTSNIIDVGPATCFRDIYALTPGVTYYYSVTAYNSMGESAYSKEVLYLPLICLRDLEPADGDVDGSDLALLATNPDLGDLSVFTTEFGRSDCFLP